MNYVAGIDVGSTQAKGIIMDEYAEIVGKAILDMETNMGTAAERVFERVLANANLSPSDIAFTVATRYGRYRVTFGDLQVTEISCHARGAVAEFPKTRTVLDIGGQDTKAIRIGDLGEVTDFAMNDKCAAGTGRFLGAASFALEMPLSDLGPLALKSTRPVKITTTCTVFAETEIIGHLAKVPMLATRERGAPIRSETGGAQGRRYISSLDGRASARPYSSDLRSPDRRSARWSWSSAVGRTQLGSDPEHPCGVRIKHQREGVIANDAHGDGAEVGVVVRLQHHAVGVELVRDVALVGSVDLGLEDDGPALAVRT